MTKQKSIHDYAKQHNMTVEQIKEFYEIEKQLASRLRDSTREERQHLYTSLYDELFRRVPFHPLITHKLNPEASTKLAARTIQFLSRFLSPDSTFLEVGPGDCSVSLQVAKHVKKVYAVDVSNEITKGLVIPRNFELVISDGISIPVPENSISIVYSNQLMEHLHPEDAIQQLQNIYNALIPGGLYICCTPNRLSGPHDVSQCFDKVATGFHLREYLATELYELFRTVGFSKISLYEIHKQIYIKFLLLPVTLLMLKIGEKLLGVLPFSFRRKIAGPTTLFGGGMTVVGIK